MSEAGWFQDPETPARWRWWDGGQWAADTAPKNPNGRTTSLPPDRAASQLVRDLSARGATVTYQQPDMVAGTVQTSPDMLTALLLFLLFVLPGLIYLFTASGSRPFSITIEPHGDGAYAIPAGEKAGQRLAVEVVRTLPSP